MNVIHEKLDDAEWLQEQVDDGKTAGDIGEIIDVHKSHVRDHLYRLDIEYKWPLSCVNYPELQDPDFIVDKLQEHKKLKDAASDIGTTETTLNRWCIRHGIDKTKYLTYYQGTVGATNTSDDTATRDYGSLDSPKYEVNAAWRDAENLWRAYWGYFWSVREIADWCGVSVGAMRHEFKRREIPMRTDSAAQNVRYLREQGADNDRIAQEIHIPEKPMYSNVDDTEREEIETDVEGFGTLVAGD